MKNVAVLIATRNRASKMAQLLDSICKSSIRPIQVVIVASGEDISNLFLKFKDLPITYLHTIQKGQIAQKKLGISLLTEDVEWCLFLDDDLLISKNAIQEALKVISRHRSNEVIGVGFSLPSTSRVRRFGKIGEKIANYFLIGSRPKGSILSSGHAVEYMSSNVCIETQWLNGASMWKKEVLGGYGIGLPSTPYAAYEDVIFSYPLRKMGSMIYVPDAKLLFQEDSATPYDSIEIFRATSYWRLFFVRVNPELSISKFFISQVARTIYAIHDSKAQKLDFLRQSLILNLTLLQSVFQNKDPRSILTKLIE